MSSPLDPPHPVNVKTIKQYKKNESIFSYFLSPFLSFPSTISNFHTPSTKSCIRFYFLLKKEVDFSTSLFYYTHGKS